MKVHAFYFCVKFEASVESRSVFLVSTASPSGLCHFMLANSNYLLCPLHPYFKTFFLKLTETSLHQISPLLASFCIDKLQGHSQRWWHEVSSLEGPLLVPRLFSFSKPKYLWELGEFGGVCTR